VAAGGSGRSAQNENVRRLKDLQVLIEEDQPRTHRFGEFSADLLQLTPVRQIARETEIPRSTQGLETEMFQKKRAQDLTETNNLSRLVCAKQLLKRYPEHVVDFIWFADEKVFTVTPRSCQSAERQGIRDIWNQEETIAC